MVSAHTSHRPGSKKKTFVTWKPPWMTSHAVVPKTSTSTKKSFLVIFDDFSTLSIPRLVCPHGKNSNSSLRSDTLKWISNMEKVHPSSRHHKVRHSVGTPLFLWSYTFQKQSLHKRTRHTTQAKRVVGMYEPSCIFYIMTRHSHTWFLIFSSRVHPYNNTRIFHNSSQSSDNVDSWSKLPSKCG